MGVPALFRWLSKKYPKIVTHVAEDKPSSVADADGNEYTVPVDITTPNPNGFEMDNLYLDMNGIVHPCTHPEGKPAPSTEHEMMLEIFLYTERVVNMIRPRKLLFMAIDGVAPRAKMNQQRSRRFRSAQEAKEKEEQRLEGIALFEAMGKTVSEETKNIKAWDSNAITPGTPFMVLLAESLRYWVVKKLNTDPGWKNLQVVISDASVPGEGEHKIMDFIRRQRISPHHDPNTKHVIYGLDADLIMLALATHEPHFRVLREDVFAQDNQTGCRICGQEGHYAAQCTVDKATLKELNDKIDKPLAEAKPFIFLDISILREYLEMELDVSAPFQFDFEQAIDDWVLLIFFVGNDFLPHLPSLEIREGAIDKLVGIWKRELHNMRGYLTNHGQIELRRAQIIFDALARQEDEIFRRRRENEERQEQNAKRRKIEQAVTVIASTESDKPKSYPGWTFGNGTDNSIPGLSTPQPTLVPPEPVLDRASIRNANLQALQALKGELSSTKSVVPETGMQVDVVEKGVSLEPTKLVEDAVIQGPGGNTVMANNSPAFEATSLYVELGADITHSENGSSVPVEVHATLDPENHDGAPESNPENGQNVIGENAPRGLKRKFEEMIAMDEEPTLSDDPGAETPSLPLKVNHDGTVEQADTVRLWEPGYKERYYRQKFGADVSDNELRKKIVKHYVEGLVWVLHYYYQGTPSWQWYYPYHFAPFASDFENIQDMDIKFERGAPFKPFEQLMGVFPAASRQHIPSPLQDLMVNEASPILDFYPPTFEIDMNGKRMAWQGVALLPFIDETRLLGAVEPLYPQLTEEEHQRNSWGNNGLFVSESHPMYDSIAALYGKRKNSEVQTIDSRKSLGLAGAVKADSEYIPGSTYVSPLQEVALGDIEDNQSITALYFYPKQTIPHRSRLLPNVKLPPRVLNSSDYEHVQRGGRGRGRGDDRRQTSYRGQEPRGYTHNYGNGGSGYGNGTPTYGNSGSNYGTGSNHQSYSNNNGWRPGSNGRGEPDYSYSPGGSSGGYRGLPPRGIARGRGYAYGSR